MKKLRRGAALLMAAATLSSLPAIPFAMPAPVIAQAVSQTRVFRFDFGSFAALYDTRGEKWYDESGELLKSQTEAVQVWKRGSLTVDFENKEAYILKTDGTKKTNAAVTDFLQNTLSAFVPDYASEYYDKAQQKNVSVPKPDAFPLTYRVLPDTDVFTVEVLIGENSLGCFTGGDDILYSGDGAVGYGRPDAFTDAGDLTVDGNISIADAIYSSRVAAEDTDMKISALGLELADEDGDGMVGIGDVRALLDELVSPILPSRAYMTQVSEIYAHEVLRDQYTKEEMSVILTDGGETWVDCYRTLNGNLDETARHHGYEDADQMLHELHEDPYAVSSLEPMDDFQRSLVASYEGSRTLHFLADCEAGEEYDKWYLSIIDDEQNYQYMEIKGIDITDAGLLKVDWIGLENSAVPTEHYNSFTHILTVKHGLWDAVKGKTFGYEDYTAMEEAEFAAMVGQLLTVTRSESTTQPPLKENQIPVLSDTRERIEWCPHGDVFYAQTDEYKNWAGKEDFELALQTMCYEDSITGERVAVLAKDDELKIYSVFNGKPEDHRLDWLKLRFDGVLDVSNIIDRRGSYKDQYDCISELQTIFVDTLKLPKNSLKADRIKSVSRYQPWSLYMDIDTAVAETFGIPWDESMGEFPYELRITVSGTNDYSQQTESSLKKKQIPADAYMMKKTDIYNNGYAYTAKDYEADVKEIREKGLLAPNDDRYGVVLKRGKGDDPDKLAMILPATVYTGLLWYISELQLDSKGKLIVTCAVTTDCEETEPDDYIAYVILPPEDLPDIQSVEFRWKQYQTQEDYEEAVFRQLYVEIVSDEKAVNSFPVTSREVLYDQYSVAWSSSTSEDENGNVTTYESKRYGSLTGNIEKTAQYHGYDSYSEMLASLENASGDVLQFLADCEEGEEYDTWYLSFISNVETFHRCEIESMDLTDAGLLNVDWEGLYIHDDPAQCYNCVTEVLTVKHGVWDEVKGTYQSKGTTSLQEEYDSEVSGVQIISRTESSPQKAEKKDSIPVLYQQTETVRWWQDGESTGSEYDNWDGKEDFELAMKTLCDKGGDGELLAVLPKGNELKVYTVYLGVPREHRLMWLYLSEDGELYITDIADMRQKEGLQQSCTSWLSTIFADTLTLPEGALASDAIKSVHWQRFYRWGCDADVSFAEIEGYPWDESKGMFPYQLRISCKGCDYSKTKQDQTILVNELMRDRYDYCAAEPDETGAGDGTGGWFCVNGLTDRIAKQHGYADEAAMMTAQLSTGTEPVFLHDCVEDKEFDALYLTDIESRTYQDCRVTDLTLESDGKMHVTWTALKKDTPDKYGEDPNIFSSVLLVRHGILEQVKEWYFERVEYDASKAAGYRELTEKPLTVKKTGKIVPVTEHEVLKDMVTVSKHSISSQDETGQTFTETEMSCQSRDGNLEKIAAIHKYETGLEMLTDLEKIDVDEHVLISCEEGEEYDKWYLSFIYDKDAYNSCEISSLSGEDYYLSIGLSLMHNENSSDPFCNVFTHILTLPHGQFQSIRSLGHYITSSKLYDESNAEQFAESLSEPLKLVLYGGHRMSSASSETYLYDEHIEKHEEITAEDLPDWEGRADYERALQTLTAEDGSGKLAVLPEKDKLKIYYTDQASSCNYAITDIRFNANNELTVTVALYPNSTEKNDMIFADTVIDLPYSWTGYETILSLKLRREIYEDPFDGDTVVRDEQWEKFRNNTSYGFSFGSESFKGVPLAFAYR